MFDRHKGERMSERAANTANTAGRTPEHMSRHLSRREVRKRMKAALALFLAVILVTQSSHIEAIAQVLVEGQTTNNEVATQQLDATTTGDATTTEGQEPAEEPAEDSTTATSSESATETKTDASTTATKDDAAKDTTKSDAAKDATKAPATDTTTDAKKDTSSKAPAADSSKPADTTATDSKDSTDTTTNTKVPAKDDTTPAKDTTPTEATLKLDLANSRLAYITDGAAKDVAKDQKTLTVPTAQDLKFTVTADDDFEVKSVKTVVDDKESDPLKANDDDEYKISADDLTDGMTIKVETEAVPEEETETDQTPADDNTINKDDETQQSDTEKTDDAKEDVEQTIGEKDDESAAESDAEKDDASEEAMEVEETTEEVVSDVTEKLEVANNALASVLMLRSGEPVKVELRLYNIDNKIDKTIDYEFASGNVNASTAPTSKDVADLSGYHFTDATVDDKNGRTEIGYVESQDGKTFYAFVEDPTYGVGLAEGEAIYFNYMADGNTVPVNVTTGGAYDVEGNAVSAAERATKGSNFSFTVSTARGYTAEVIVNGESVESNGGVYTVAVSGNAASVEISVTFAKENSVTFNPGAFNDPTLENLYDNTTPRFDFIGDSATIKTRPVGEDGASFTFQFKTRTNANTWWIDSFEINGIYLNIPTERTKGASASTVLYPEENGMDACVAKLTITNVSRENVGSNWNPNYRYSYTYELTITGARENITIDFANLNNPGWAEVVPTATEGVSFVSSGTEHTLSKPYALNASPWFKFATESGYKNLKAQLIVANGDGERLDTIEIALPTQVGRSQQIQYSWETGPSWHPSTETVTLATVELNNDGSYTFSFRNGTGSSGITVQFLQISAELETYGVSYDAGEGSNAPIDSNVYNVVSNGTVVVANGVPTPPEGKQFSGWTIEGDQSGKVYYAGDAVDLTDPAINSLISESAASGKDGVLGFNARYVDSLQSGDPIQVPVYYQVQSDDGSYKTVKTSSIGGKVGGSTYLRTYDKEYEYDGITYQYSNEDSDLIAVGGASGNDGAIFVRYNLPAVTLHYASTDETMGTVSPASEDVTVKDAWANGSTATAKPGYEFVGWYGNEECTGEPVSTDKKFAPSKPEGGWVEATYYAKWKPVPQPIYIEVYKDNVRVNASDYAEASNLDGHTADFNATNDGDRIKVTYTYNSLNCADIALLIKNFDGYSVSVDSDKRGETPSINPGEDSVKCTITGSNANWKLDNIPSGATIRVDLTPDPAQTYDVEYKATNGTVTAPEGAKNEGIQVLGRGRQERGHPGPRHRGRHRRDRRGQARLHLQGLVHRRLRRGHRDRRQERRGRLDAERRRGQGRHVQGRGRHLLRHHLHRRVRRRRMTSGSMTLLRAP